MTAENSRQRQKLKDIKKGIDMAYRVTTEARAANVFAAQFHSTAPRAVYGTTEDLPSCMRRVVISKPFPAIR